MCPQEATKDTFGANKRIKEDMISKYSNFAPKIFSRNSRFEISSSLLNLCREQHPLRHSLINYEPVSAQHTAVGTGRAGCIV